MYSRPQYGRYAHEVRVPENYSGNAFREEPPSPPVEEMTENMTEKTVGFDGIRDENSPKDITVCEGTESMTGVVKKTGPLAGFGLDIGKLFKHGLGFEELLIIGLMLLISQGDNNDDILILLAILLFV